MTNIFDSLLALILIVVLNAFIVRAISHSVPNIERPFIVRVYLATLTLRGFLAFVMNTFVIHADFARYFWGDSSTYDRYGHLLSLYWSGELLVNPILDRWVSGWGFNYFVGLLYYLFGRNQLLAQLINSTIGSLTVYIVYLIARRLFNTDVARRAAVLMAFFPQMVFWSTGIYKDPSILLCISLAMYAVIRISDRFSLPWIMLFMLSSLLLMTLRFYVFYVLVFATFASFLVAQKRSLFASVIVYTCFAGVFVGVFSFAARGDVESQMEYFDFQKIQIARLDQTQSASSGFAEGNVSTLAGALTAVPRGLLFLLFAPFPWAASGLRQGLVVPEMIVWYALMPAFWRGFRFAIKMRFRSTLPIIIFTIMLTLAYAVTQGNIGTAYRQRTQITMFFFIFIGVGLVMKRRSDNPRVILMHSRNQR